LWFNNPPLDGINPENFSVVWRGWVKAPTDGEYTFYLKVVFE
jgi:hypothetical protein